MGLNSAGTGSSNKMFFPQSEGDFRKQIPNSNIADSYINIELHILI